MQATTKYTTTKIKILTHYLDLCCPTNHERTSQISYCIDISCDTDDLIIENILLRHKQFGNVIGNIVIFIFDNSQATSLQISVTVFANKIQDNITIYSIVLTLNIKAPYLGYPPFGSGRNTKNQQNFTFNFYALSLRLQMQVILGRAGQRLRFLMAIKKYAVITARKIAPLIKIIFAFTGSPSFIQRTDPQKILFKIITCR